ncbi:MAG: hypothetical protein E6K81_08880 [Candidatus Eisenbacteria bacterium]|uniref:Uncharacterized protein n=1 Tax=Eiseniibacteriota bacterium TaxID=2212470 RepID=A0A538U7P9_UNCEI|nr:MAG: hypothetical protein E6K81_08880 [Candidatus Eisenbacteria bacterium]
MLDAAALDHGLAPRRGCGRSGACGWPGWARSCRWPRAEGGGWREGSIAGSGTARRPRRSCRGLSCGPRTPYGRTHHQGSRRPPRTRR